MRNYECAAQIEYATRFEHPESIESLQKLARSKQCSEALKNLKPWARSYVRAYRKYLRGRVRNSVLSDQERQTIKERIKAIAES